MAQNKHPRKNWVVRRDKVGVRFIKLEEILDVVEQKSDSAEQEEQINKHAELRIKLSHAVTRNRQERELNEHILQQGQELEILIKEKTDENNNLASRVNELRQEVAKLNEARQRMSDEEDKPSEVCSELKKTVVNQSVHLTQIKDNIKEVQEQKKKLTTQRDQLTALMKKTQESISTHTAAEMILKVKLEELKKTICEKDKQIQDACLCLKSALNKICDYDISKELALDWKKISEELRKRQGRTMCMLKIFQQKKILPKGASQLLLAASGPVTETHKQRKTLRWTYLCAEYTLKATKTIAVCGLCVMMISNLVSLCSSPDCDLWTILFEFIETHSEVELALPSIF